MERVQEVLLTFLVFICICSVLVAFYILIQYAVAINSLDDKNVSEELELTCNIGVNELDNYSSIDLSCIKK